MAVTSGGTIPDRGLFGVFLPDGTRVGELDEEMVYESRPGETFMLGASTWRIEDITFERVTVTPAPGEQGKMPFWHGDRPGRPLELGRALGAFQREMRTLDPDAAVERLMSDYCLDRFAAGNVVAYLDEQAQATGVVPDDRTVVIERFRDEIGDWRVCILTPFGTPVHAPWAMAIERRLLERYDMPIETMWSDDGIVLRLPEAADTVPIADLIIDPDDIDELVVGALPQTSLFSARFRECAARALLLPRRRPDRRTPLWQQRQRAADLLAVAAKYPSFPILLETSRECLQDVFDLPALREVLGQLRSRAVRVVSVDTAKGSPFAQSLLFNWIAAYMYEGDAPLAERRAAALSLDRDLLRDLLGAEELRELLDPGVLADVELELQCVADGRRARSADELHDVLRKVGDLTVAEVDLRGDGPAGEWISIWCAHVGRSRSSWVASSGSSPPKTRPGIAMRSAATSHSACRWRSPSRSPIRSNHWSPVTPERTARSPRPTWPIARRRRSSASSVPSALWRPLIESCTASSAPVGSVASTAMSTCCASCAGGRWRCCGARSSPSSPRRTPDSSRRGMASPASGAVSTRWSKRWPSCRAHRWSPRPWRAELLPARLRSYRAADLDELCTTGDVVWVGAGAIGPSDGRVRLYFADQFAGLDASLEAIEPPTGPLHDAIRAHLASHGASFWNQLRSASAEATDVEMLAALWDLVWAGEVSNDSLAPLRAVLSGGKSARSSSSAPRGRPRPGRLTRIGPPAGAGRWSLVAPQRMPAPSPTQAAHAAALQLLERYGVVTREAVLAEGVKGGYAAAYSVLKVLEERGQVRRGYFVAGLGAAQFALPGAVDRLRSARDVPDPLLHPELMPAAVVLASTDPAQPYGAALDWPESPGRPSRTAGAVVVLRCGVPLAWFDRRSSHLVTFPASADGSWAEALATLVKDGRQRSIEVRKVNGAPIDRHGGEASALLAAGFAEGYRGFVLRGV